MVRLKKKSRKVNNVLFLGASKSHFLPFNERLALQKVGISNIQTIQCFQMCQINHLIFKTSAERNRMRCDSVVELNGEYFQIDKMFVADSKPLCFVSKIILSKLCEANPFGFKVIRVSKELHVFNIANFSSKFISSRTNFGSLLYLIKLPNTSEFE